MVKNSFIHVISQEKKEKIVVIFNDTTHNLRGDIFSSMNVLVLLRDKILIFMVKKSFIHVISQEKKKKKIQDRLNFKYSNLPLEYKNYTF